MDTRPIKFWKLTGSGNDFICIDNTDGRFDDLLACEVRLEHFARTLCHRSLGVGADGVIFACRPEIQAADIGARFLEADGSECELCGNGTACFTRWAIDLGLTDRAESRILTPAGVVRGMNVEGDFVRVCIPAPQDIRTDLSIHLDGRAYECDLAVTGVPHVIHFVEDIDAVDVDRVGRLLRHHETFQPRGANVNFVQVLDKGYIAVRTYEFGVEGETLACGTGSAASAILTALRFGWNGDIRSGDEPVRVLARSGDTLRIWFTLTDDGQASDVCLETVVRELFRGVLHENLAALALGPAETVP